MRDIARPLTTCDWASEEDRHGHITNALKLGVLLHGQEKEVETEQESLSFVTQENFFVKSTVPHFEECLCEPSQESSSHSCPKISIIDISIFRVLMIATQKNSLRRVPDLFLARFSVELIKHPRHLQKSAVLSTCFSGWSSLSSHLRKWMS